MKLVKNLNSIDDWKTCSPCLIKNSYIVNNSCDKSSFYIGICMYGLVEEHGIPQW